MHVLLVIGESLRGVAGSVGIVWTTLLALSALLGGQSHESNRADDSDAAERRSMT